MRGPKSVWIDRSKGNQKSDMGNLTMLILLLTAKNAHGCKQVIHTSLVELQLEKTFD